MRILEKDTHEIVYLAFTGYPLSQIAELKFLSEKGIRDLLIRVVKNFEKFEGLRINYESYVPEVVQVDEIYVKIQGEERFYAWLAYDPVNKFLIDFELGHRDQESLEKLFQRLSKYRGKVKLCLIDGYRGFEDVIKKYFGKNGHMPTTGVLNKSRFIKKTNKFFTYGIFGKSRAAVEELIRHYGIGKEISTALIERFNRDIRDRAAPMKRRTHRLARLLSWIELFFRGIRFLHNYTKPHWALSERSSKNWICTPVTPGMHAGVCIKTLTILEVLKTPISS